MLIGPMTQDTKSTEIHKNIHNYIWQVNEINLAGKLAILKSKIYVYSH